MTSPRKKQTSADKPEKPSQKKRTRQTKSKKPGSINFTKAGKPTKDQLLQVKALASCGVNQRTIADYIGVGRKTFWTKLEDDEDLKKVYRLGLAEAKEKIMTKAFEKATEGNGDTVMLIFLSKALCGLREQGEAEDEIADKAAAIRDALDQMNSGLQKYVDKDGNFKDPKDVSSSEKKTPRKSSRSRRNQIKYISFEKASG